MWSRSLNGDDDLMMLSNDVYNEAGVPRVIMTLDGNLVKLTNILRTNRIHINTLMVHG